MPLERITRSLFKHLIIVIISFALTGLYLRAQSERLHEFELESPKQLRALIEKSQKLIDEGHAKEVLGFAFTLESPQRQLFLEGVLDDIIKGDHGAVVAWMESEPAKAVDYLENAQIAVLGGYAPERLLIFAKRFCPLDIEDENGPPQSVETLCRVERAIVSSAFKAIAEVDPEKAAYHIMHWKGSGILFFNGLSQIASVWAESSPNDLYQFLSTQASEYPSVALKSLGLESLRKLSGKREWKIDDEGEFEFYYQLVEAMIEVDGGEATAQWLDGEASRSKAVLEGRLGELWIKKDLKSAVSWIGNLKKGEEKDDVLAHVISFLGRKAKGNEEFRKTALELGEMVNEPRHIQMSLYSLFQDWFFEDPAAAAKALDQCNIVDEKWRNRLVRFSDRLSAELEKPANRQR